MTVRTGARVWVWAQHIPLTEVVQLETTYSDRVHDGRIMNDFDTDFLFCSTKQQV